MMRVLAALRRRVVGVLPLVLLAGLVTGCQTVQTTHGGVVGVDREQMMLVSSAEVNRSAEKA